MKTKATILRALNQVLHHELTLINQYFLHARMFNNWGYNTLGQPIYKQSIQAMKNADAIIARVFFLEGLPNLQHLGKLNIGESVPEALQCDLQMSMTYRQTLQQCSALLEQEEDFVSRALLLRLLHEIEEYIDWLEEQLGLIASLGLENFLQRAITQAA